MQMKIYCDPFLTPLSCPKYTGCSWIQRGAKVCQQIPTHLFSHLKNSTESVVYSNKYKCKHKHHWLTGEVLRLCATYLSWIGIHTITCVCSAEVDEVKPEHTGIVSGCVESLQENLHKGDLSIYCRQSLSPSAPTSVEENIFSSWLCFCLIMWRS